MRRTQQVILVGRVVTIIILMQWIPAIADRHVGYYYPQPESIEEYISKTLPLRDANRNIRVLFVTDFTTAMLQRSYSPDFVMFVKGAEAEKMIITSLESNRLNTIYRMRALLAMLTSRARETQLFSALDENDLLNFLDLLKFLGFAQVTLTDGDRFSHQILIK